ncbi:cDNA sequence BC094274 [Mus musculus]|nr:cDNA sequence BC094274 [Mus musculus]
MLASSFQVLWAPETSFLEFLKPSLWGDGNQAACTPYTSPSSPLIGNWAKGEKEQAVSLSTSLFPMFLRTSVRGKKNDISTWGRQGEVCVGGQAQSGLCAGLGPAEHPFQRLPSLLHPILGHTQPSEAAHSRAGCDC